MVTFQEEEAKPKKIIIHENSDQNLTNVPRQDSYYLRGSQELATETALTLERLKARRTLTKNCGRLVLVLVGLPARGKSFLARKLTGFLNWHGIQTKVFNVGKYRRQVETTSSGADFFDAKNTQAAALREKAAALALDDLLQWLHRQEQEESPCLDETEVSATTSSGEEENDDEDDEAASSFLTMNPESFKSERYTGNTRRTSSTTPTAKQQQRFEQIMSIPDIVTSQELLKRERIAIFDATNSTNARRQWILETCRNFDQQQQEQSHDADTAPTSNGASICSTQKTQCVFIESICNDQELLMENFHQKIANSPDYKDMPKDDAIVDLKRRVQKYEEQYETIEDDSLSYIKIYNLSSKILANQIYGRMSKIIMPAMMAWNIGTRPIFLCRPGQTLGNITTDSEDYVGQVDMEHIQDYKVLEMSRNSQKTFLRGYHLGLEGRQFSQNLLKFCQTEGKMFVQKQANIINNKNNDEQTNNETQQQLDEADEDDFPLQIYTSTMPRATQTVKWNVDYDLDVVEESNLNPLDKGDFAGKELDEIRNTHPTFYRKLVRDAFHTRFPGGESYYDLIKRLDAVIVDLEQQVTPTLVVSHVSILQMLIAYFRNSPIEKCMDIEVPLHTVIKFTPARGGGWSESIHPLAPVHVVQTKHDKLIQQQGPSVPTSATRQTAPPSKKNGFFWPLFQKFTAGDSDQERGEEQTVSASSVLDERTHRGRTMANP